MVRATPANRQRIAEVVAARGLPPGRNREPVLARVNHGRWTASCECNGAELVSEGEDMLCGSCGRTSPVEFPDGQDRIEALLLKRPVFNQNWYPGESEAEILAENIDQGIFPEDL